MILEIENVSKNFYLGHGTVLPAVSQLSLAIREQEVLGLVGESGCGKSTLARMIAGLLPKTLGEIIYRGQKLPTSYTARDFFRYAREINMIFQDPYSSLDPRMTVREIIAEGPLLHKLWPRAKVDHEVATWLQKVGLSPQIMSRYPHEFSGGQRQRIGIARALALNLKFLICDEPISALDVSVQAQVANLLSELKASMGLTMLFIAHDLSMVRYISDRIAVMYLGKLVELGPADRVYFHFLHPYTRLLISSNPLADPKTARERQRATMAGEIPSPTSILKATPSRGCLFAARCPQVMPQCHHVEPGFREIEANHFVACHACVDFGSPLK